jgi:hypothetical protein
MKPSINSIGLLKAPLLIVAAMTVLLTGSLSAASANFDTDTFPSAAGNGWSGAWTLTSNAGIGRTAAIQSSSALSSGSGNYLETVITNNGTNTGARAGTLFRQLDSGSIDLTSIFTVSFDFRSADAVNTNGPFSIIQSSASKLGRTGADTWSVYLKSDGNWYALNGNKAGGGTESLLLAYSANTTYHFSVTVDSTTRSYSISATAIGGSSATLSNLGFRTSDTSAGSFLNFVATSSSTSTDGSDKVINTFDIDNVLVTSAIPEPANIALLAGLGALGLIVCSRRFVTHKAA